MSTSTDIDEELKSHPWLTVDEAISTVIERKDHAVKYARWVVVDTIDGYMFWQDSTGALFTKESATAFARVRNDERKPQSQTYALFELTSHPVDGKYTLSPDGTVVYPL